MKIKELSVGDWVRNPTTGSNYKITSTFLNPMGEMLTAQVGGEGKDIRCFSENIEPILITPEILEKNGFVKESEVGYERFEWRENGSVAITLNRDSFSKSETFVLTTFKIGINGWLLKIEHVHQLQHAIRLAGIEKEIEV